MSNTDGCTGTITLCAALIGMRKVLAVHFPLENPSLANHNFPEFRINFITLCIQPGDGW